MIDKDGNPTLEWFKKTYRDNDKYMSKLMFCEQVILLNTLYFKLTHANTLFVCTCRFISLCMTIIVTGTYVSLTLVQKDVYIYWTLCQVQLGKTFEQRMCKQWYCFLLFVLNNNFDM